MSNQPIIDNKAVDQTPPRQKFCQAMAETWRQVIVENQKRHVSVRCLKQGWGDVQHGNAIDGCLLRVGGEEFQHGFGTHADSEILLRAEEGLTRFSGVAGFAQNGATLQGDGAKARLLFAVEVADREIWRSTEINVRSAGAHFDLALPTGTLELALKVWSVDGDCNLAHANWAATCVELASGEKIKLGQPSYPSVPFSFVYEGKSSIELLPNWEKTSISRPGTKAGVTEHVVTWKDPAGAMECRLELLEFSGYPALEWVVYFRNAGKSDTPLLENIQALDVTWGIRSSVSYENLAAHLYRSRGSTFRATDFEYVEDKLLAHEGIRMIAGQGRSSQNWLPFFNADLGDKGVFTAIGWSGQWACSFDHAASGELHVRAGMEKTHLKLHPSEEIRSPRILQLFWKEDRIEGHNMLRRFLLNHHSPHIDGKPITGPFTIAHWGGMGTQLHLDRLAVYQREKLPQEYLWVDAGWYGWNSSYSPDEFLGDWNRHTGDWRVNPKAHPAGLKPIVEAAKAAGMKFMLWVEPARAVKGTLWPEQHPDWFLGNDDHLLLNLGKPEALQGCIELLSNLIRENDIALYREDFNINPLDYWQKNDAPDRQGMTEIRFTEGVYSLWDALLDRHPGLIIDNCASGGRRIDLETISRSIALWRSDLQCFPNHDPTGTQAQAMGLSYWLPLHGSGTWGAMPTKERCSTYLTRSTMGPAFMLSTFTRESNPIQDDYPWDWFRKMCSDYMRARPLYTGDYYPLTQPVSADAHQWAVYQMDRPDLGEGFVMAFRRKDTPWEKGTFKLRALDPNASYEWEDADTGKIVTMTGSELSQGLKITLSAPESSALMFYKKR